VLRALNARQYFSNMTNMVMHLTVMSVV